MWRGGGGGVEVWWMGGKLDFQEVQLVGSAGEPGGHQDPSLSLSPRNFPLGNAIFPIDRHMSLDPRPLSPWARVMSFVTLLMCQVCCAGKGKNTQALIINSKILQR